MFYGCYNWRERLDSVGTEEGRDEAGKAGLVSFSRAYTLTHTHTHTHTFLYRVGFDVSFSLAAADAAFAKSHR